MFQRKEKLWVLFQLLGLFPVFVLTIYYRIMQELTIHLKSLWWLIRLLQPCSKQYYLDRPKKAETFWLVELASQALSGSFGGAFSKKLYFSFILRKRGTIRIVSECCSSFYALGSSVSRESIHVLI